MGRALFFAFLILSGPTFAKRGDLFHQEWIQFSSPSSSPEIRELLIPKGFRAEARLTDAEVVNLGAAWAEEEGPVNEWGEEGGADPQVLGPGWLQVIHQPQRLWIKVFPIRKDSRGGYFLKRGLLEIEVREDGSELEWGGLWKSDALLIAPQRWLDAATELQTLHYERTRKRIEVLSWDRFKNTVPTDQDLSDLPYRQGRPDGYLKADRDKKIIWDERGARLLISEIRARLKASGHSIQSVLILGDANEIPPSHYLYFKGRKRWLPTDACYGGEQGCLPGKVSVGRLPFAEKKDWESYLRKLQAWTASAKTEFNSLLSLAGKAFPGPVFLGELAAIEITDNRLLGVAPVEKFHSSRANYGEKNVRAALSGETGKPLLLHFDHGEGDEIRFDSTKILSSEMAAFPASPKLPPVLTSIACANAAFDAELVNEKIFLHPQSRRSIAEEFVTSPGGGVAYVGSLRRAMGEPVFEFDPHGNVLVKELTYGTELLSAFTEAWLTGPSETLGEAHLESLRKYLLASTHSTETERHQWTLFNFALLGDPLLPLPRRNTPIQSEWKGRSITVLTEKWLPFPPMVPVLKDRFRVALEVSDRTTVEILKVWEEGQDSRLQVVSQRGLRKGEVSFDVEAKPKEGEGERYLIRLQNAVEPFQERQVWVTTPATR